MSEQDQQAYRVTAGELRAFVERFEKLDALKRGSKVQREGWNGKDLVVVLDRGTDIRMPSFKLHKPDGKIESWNPSTPDCLADDWQIVN